MLILFGFFALAHESEERVSISVGVAHVKKGCSYTFTVTPRKKKKPWRDFSVSRRASVFGSTVMQIHMEHDSGDQKEEFTFTNSNNHFSDDFWPPRKKPKCQYQPSSEPITHDLFSHLPDECIFQIFSFLPASRDRCSCAAVSKKWLTLQANMRNSAFKSHKKPSTNPRTFATLSSDSEIKRCLEGKKANDTRLAAIAVGIDARGKLSELCIRASFPSITDSGLNVIGFACPSLKSLTLWNCVKVGNQGLVSISKGCVSLEKLDLFECPLVRDQALVAVAKNCPNLKTLNLQKCPQIGNDSLRAVGKFSSKVESISLKECPLVNDDGVFAVISSLSMLEKLQLASIDVSNAALAAILEYGKSLKCLYLEGTHGIAELGFRGNLENDRVLSLKSCNGLNETSFTAIGNGFLGLKQISIKNCGSLTNGGLKELTRSTTSLESLKLEECNGVSFDGLLEAVNNCSHSLKVLSLVKCEGIEEPPANSATVLPKCQFLKSITIRNCSRIGDGFLSWIGKSCLEVKHLELSKLSSVTDQGILNLLNGVRRETNLANVDLSECFRITDWSVFAIANLFGEKIQSLNLEGCKGVTDTSLEIVADRCPSMLDLDLSKCSITDNGVFCLANRHHFLKVLSLSGCLSITNNCLHMLELMGASLIGLNLKNCPSLTKKSIDSIRTTLWWCDIVC